MTVYIGYPVSQTDTTLVGKGSYADNRQSKTLETWMPLSNQEIHKQICS